MAFSYNKLWKLMIDQKTNREALRKATGISSATIAKMGKDENVSMEILGKVCMFMNCDVGDIVEFHPDK